jgi:DNA-binding transcriptional LysR family regulator
LPGRFYFARQPVAESDERRILATTLDRYTRQVGTFQILWPSGRQRSPKVKAFVDFTAITLFASGA